jgi:tripartite ATP-independent transporter DctM subunit
MVWVLVILGILFILSGSPLAYVIGAAGVMAFVVAGKISYLAVLPQRIFSQLDVFALMAMALFIMTGEIMTRLRVTKALIDFSICLVGRFKGGLGHVNVLTNIFFAGVSGSAVADAAALSNTLVPAMQEQGYSRRYAAAITAAGSVIGPIIPPSIILVFYGALMQVSVAALLIAGVIPGLLLGAGLMAANAYFAHRDNHPGGRGEELPPFWPTLRKALPALSLPLIILGGIVFGIATPTEAAGIAVVAALGVGGLYGGLKKETVYRCVERTAILCGTIFMVMSAAACVAWIGGLEQWPQKIAALVTKIGLGRIGILFLVNGIFIIAGMIMDLPMNLALLVPLLAPACTAQGVHPVHLGLILCLNLTIGLITPPVVGSLVVVSSISGEDYWSLSRAIVPFIVVEVLVLIFLILVPEVSLFLPRLAGYL